MEKTDVFEGNITDRSFGITQETFEILLKIPQKRRSDAISLYNFYCYTSKFQGTDRVWCTTSFASKGVGITPSRIREARSILKEIGLIEDRAIKDKKGKISKHIIVVKYILSVNQKQSKTSMVENKSVENPPQMLNYYKENAYSKDILLLNNNNISQGAENDISENHEYKNNPKTPDAPIQAGDPDDTSSAKPRNQINSVIGFFKEINPMGYSRSYAIPSHRKAVEQIIDLAGGDIDAIRKAILKIKETNNEPFAPIITTPIEFINKYPKFVAHIKRKEVEQNSNKIKFIFD